MADKLPYFRWFPGDAEADENYRSMDDTEVGFFHRALNFAWINGGLPGDLDELARLFRVSREYVDRLWPRVSRCFELSDGRFRNPRQEEERSKAVSKSASATNAVRSRYERSSNELPRAQARAEHENEHDSDSSVVVKPPNKEKASTRARPQKLEVLSPLDGKIHEIARRIHDRHPAIRRCGPAEVRKKLSAIARRFATAEREARLVEIDRNHAAWCDSPQWSEAGGQYAKGLGNWLAPTEERWSEPPPDPSELAPRALIKSEQSFVGATAVFEALNPGYK